MRLYTKEKNDIKKFYDWIEAIGDGTIVSQTNYGSKIQFSDDILNDHGYQHNRVILAPTLDVVRSINDHMITLNSKEARTYLSSDRSCMSDSNFDVHTPELLNTLKCYGVLDHELNLKVETHVMLLRNIDH
ncbi:hypothetical protein ACS0TY_035804 [Phlomoides rotata]